MLTAVCTIILLFAISPAVCRLFEMGFAAQLHEILKQLGDERQTSLFSATLPKQLVDFTRAGLKDPVVIRLDVESKISPQLHMTFFTMRRDQKSAALLILLRQQVEAEQQTIVFASTRHHVEYLHGLLTASDIPSAPVYGQLDPAARKINLVRLARNYIRAPRMRMRIPPAAVRAARYCAAPRLAQ
jgi:ATP-dependent RNA helicase DDX54/DBP10